jgi:hypothetical protein
LVSGFTPTEAVGHMNRQQRTCYRFRSKTIKVT